MRFLHTADLHLGRSLENKDRLNEQQAVLDEIVSIAEQESCDLVLLSGDIFDSFIPSAAAECLFFDFLFRLSNGGKRAVVAISGNHDQPERLSAASNFAEQSGVYLIGLPGQEFRQQPASDNVYIEQSGKALHLRLPSNESVVIAAMPFLSESRMNELYLTNVSSDEETVLDQQEKMRLCLLEQSAEFRADTVNLVMAHLFVFGGAVSDSERPLISVSQVGGSFGVNQSIFPDCDYVALGHLHRPQIVAAKEEHPYIVYAGSPLAYSFSEADQIKRVIVGDISGTEKTVVITEHQLHSGIPLHIESFSDYGSALKWCEKEENRNCWLEIRIRLSQPLSVTEIDALHGAHPRLITITPIYEALLTEQERVRQEEQLSIGERFRHFVMEKDGTECDDSLLNAFFSLLEQ